MLMQMSGKYRRSSNAYMLVYVRKGDVHDLRVRSNSNTSNHTDLRTARRPAAVAFAGAV